MRVGDPSTRMQTFLRACQDTKNQNRYMKKEPQILQMGGTMKTSNLNFVDSQVQETPFETRTLQRQSSYKMAQPFFIMSMHKICSTLFPSFRYLYGYRPIILPNSPPNDFFLLNVSSWYAAFRRRFLETEIDRIGIASKKRLGNVLWRSCDWHEHNSEGKRDSATQTIFGTKHFTIL